MSDRCAARVDHAMTPAEREREQNKKEPNNSNKEKSEVTGGTETQLRTQTLKLYELYIIKLKKKP